MSSQEPATETDQGAARIRRRWCGLFGAFVGGVLGLVLGGWLQMNLLLCVLLGAIVSGGLAFFFGLDVLEALLYWWT